MMALLARSLHLDESHPRTQHSGCGIRCGRIIQSDGGGCGTMSFIIKRGRVRTYWANEWNLIDALSAMSGPGEWTQGML